jgi:2-polyprenyl-6-methoxyphenol hydroxylase-like FAD-dependent oxidoreductase
MQPNLGQGGCMAIEDAFQLGMDVEQAMNKVGCCWWDAPGGGGF